MFVGLVSGSILNMVDVAMVSRLGMSAVAAIGYSFFLFWLAHAFFIGIGSAVQTYTARVSEGGLSVLNPLKTGLIMSVVFGGGITWLVGGSLDAILHRFILDHDVRSMAHAYFSIRLWGLMPMMAHLVFQGFYNGSKRPRIYFYVILVTNVCNIILNYGLIFGHFGFPAMGIVGAGWASTISLWVGLGMYGGMATYQYGIRALIRGMTGWQPYRSIMMLGGPLGVQEVSFAASWGVFLWMVGRIGVNEVAIANAVIVIVVFVWNLAFSVGVTTQTLVSEGMNQSRFVRHDVMRTARRVGVACVLGVSIMVMVGNKWLLGLFFSSDAIIRQARIPLFMDVGIMWVECLALIYIGALQGMGKGGSILATRWVIQWCFLVPFTYAMVTQWGTLWSVWVGVVMATIIKWATMRYVWSVSDNAIE